MEGERDDCGNPFMHATWTCGKGREGLTGDCGSMGMELGEKRFPSAPQAAGPEVHCIQFLRSAGGLSSSHPER